MMKRIVFSIVLIVVWCLGSSAQEDMRQLSLWNASWVTVPDIDPQGYGVYEFQKELELDKTVQPYIVYVTGDNRYKLFVNDQLVSVGPARSDLKHWNYETVDLAPYIKKGKNTVKAIVWNEGKERSEANMSSQTAFLLLGLGEAACLNTDESWLCRQDSRYSPKDFALTRMTYMVTGPGERIDMNREPADWRHAAVVTPAIPVDAVGCMGHTAMSPAWVVQPSMIRPRELNAEHTLDFKAVTIPAHSEQTILLDNQVLTNAYVTMKFSKGKDSHITLTYQESLFTDYPHKGNRNETKGKQMIGREDEIISNGQIGQSVTTLSFRTYRYVQLTVKTADEPLTINDLYGEATGYPFELKARLDTENKELRDFLTIGWRTAKLCAWETYTDCPYYEQLQYFGDARIQMLVTLFNVGDDAFVRNYLNLADESRNVEGVTQSRYPAKTPQYITPYALHYIYSLHDYMMYSHQRAFIADKLMGMRAILHYFHRFQTADGRLKDLPGWNFTDWVDGEKNWLGGICLPGADGGSCVMDLQLLYAYQLAADLERQLGLEEQAVIYEQRAEKLSRAIESAYWDAGRGLFADHAEKDAYSQHANALAIVTGLVKGERALAIARKLEGDASLAPASIYFKFYVHQAMTMAGLGDHYLQWLDKWRENIRMGLTTWAETSDVDGTRSDCHAWGASPNIEFFRTILGIDSDAPGFSKVRIEPHLGDIQKIGGEVPHPEGMIRVDYEVTGEQIKAIINLPVHTTGTFIWKGKTYYLNTGKNEINTAETVHHSIKPGAVWTDTNGKPIQAHGFQIFVKDDTYYWYGENKEKTVAGSSVWTYGIRCYRSKDFYNWEDCGLIIPPDTVNYLSPLHYSQTLDRPHILYCEKTGKYVCWIKSMDEDGYFVILQADNILGPYEYVRSIRPEGYGVGDFDMFSDEKTRKGYIWFERPHWELICAELTDDYTNVTGQYSHHMEGRRPPYTREAPTHFLYKGKHYLFTSGTTGYYPNESLLSTFADYHGEYKDLGNPHPADKSKTSFWSQITDVVKIPGRNLYVAVADRWMPQIVGTDEAAKEFEKNKILYRDYQPNERDFSEIVVKDKRHLVRTDWDVTYNATYVFLPIVFKNGKPQIEWKDEWRIEDYK